MQALLNLAILLATICTVPRCVLSHKHNYVPGVPWAPAATMPVTLIDRAVNPVRCSPGTYSSNGLSPCTDCRPGTFTNENGATACRAARPGYYVPEAGATAERPCQRGSYSSAPGSTSCTPCPPGYQCISDNLANPQMCSPGRYSTGGAVECSRCRAGTFNNIQGSTGCCDCCAGWYNDQPGNTNCQRCSNQFPYSNPGTASTSGCSAKPGMWKISPTCTQPPSGACPTSTPYTPASPLARRRVAHAPMCRSSDQKACAVHGYTWRVNGHHHHGATKTYECVNIQTDLESCGGCVTHSLDGQKSPDGGRDCSAIPSTNSVRCVQGRCVIDSCRPGFKTDAKGEFCVPTL